MTTAQRRWAWGAVIGAVLAGAVAVSVGHQRRRDRALLEAGAKRIEPWPEWAGWWHTAAACLAVPEVPISTVTFLELAPTVDIPAILDAEPNSRAVTLLPDTVVFRAGGQADSALVLHEMTHVGRRKGGHPAKYFDGRCGVLPHVPD